MKRSVGLMLAVAVVLLGFAGPAAAKPTFDKAMDQVFASGYPQEVVDHLSSLGTNPDLGFRWGGTTADDAAARYLASEMKKAGLKNVRLEPVPLDEFEFTHADVTVGARVMTASTFSGVSPTPFGGITTPVVYVHQGTAADFDAAPDVKGKLVLIDKAMSSWWFNLPGWEAWHRGAAGVILTSSLEDPKYYGISPDALGSLDSYYDLAAPPMVYISRTDGDWLKTQITGGPTTATMTLNEKITLAKDGGLGYNVVATMPGTGHDGQKTIIGAYHDSHFRRGLNDAGALANTLAMVKAMNKSGFQPKHTIVFVFTAGEEGATANAYYDWLVGATKFIRAHPRLGGTARVFFSMEGMAYKGSPLQMNINPELKPWFEGLSSEHAKYLPYGYDIQTPITCWNDQFIFTVRGIPSVEFITQSQWQSDNLTFTNYDTADVIDWDYLAQIGKFVFRVERSIDQGLVPYSLKTRADDLATTVDAPELIAAGADATEAQRLAGDVAAFQAAAGDFESSASSIPDGKVGATNLQLVRIEKSVNCGLTAITQWDPVVYPHQQVLWDAQGLRDTIAALEQTVPDPDAALGALGNTYMTWYGTNFSYPVYLKEIGRHDPDYDRIRWGGWGKLPQPLDVMPQYRLIEQGDYDLAIAGLERKLASRVGELDERIATMAALLERVTPRIKALP